MLWRGRRSRGIRFTDGIADIPLIFSAQGIVFVIVNHYALRNVQFLASNIGNHLSAKKFSDVLKSQKISASTTQMQNYTEYLANAFLIHKMS